MSSLPKEVQAQIDNANQIQAALIEAGVVTGEEVAEVEASAEERVAEENGDLKFAESGQEQEVQNEVDVEVETFSDPEEESFKHKYNTLQGMFRAEKAQHAAMRNRVSTLENMLASMPTTPAAPAAEASSPDQTFADSLTPEEREEYGDDMIGVIQRAANEPIAKAMQALQNEITQLKSQLGHVDHKVEVSEKDRFYNQLEQIQPGWQNVNQDVNFLAWLDEDDVYAAEPRKVLLRKAFDRSDASRVARFFSGFLNENAAVQKATSPTTPAAAGTKKSASNGKVDLASLAAPGAGSASASADSTDSSSIQPVKASDIKRFYEDVVKGVYKSDPERKLALETQIQAAMQSGNVLAGQ